MTGHRKDILDIQRLIQLKARGESNGSIARLLNTNRNTVNEYILNLRNAGKDFYELSRLNEESIVSKQLFMERSIFCKAKQLHNVPPLETGHKNDVVKPSSSGTL